MGDSILPGIEAVRKKSTAELRQRFPAIKALLQEGYTHKQICGLLNSAGMSISYGYYRVVMTRLRAEFESSPFAQPSATSKTVARSDGTQMQPPSSGGHNDENPVSLDSEKSLSWDPVAPVQWK